MRRRPHTAGAEVRAVGRGVLVAVQVVVVALLVAGCSTERDTESGTGRTRPGSSGSPGESPSLPDPPLPDPVLRDAACPDGLAPAGGISCQTLVVPEDRSEPEGRQVELPVVRVAGTSTRAEVAPVVVLHGGPGAGVVQRWASWTTALPGLGAELVLYDQRGAGSSTPRLDCPEHAEALRAVLATADPWPDERTVVAGALARCHERITGSGVDLDQYDTPASTRDLEDLRVALGAEQLTLLGQSYGTRLALDYLRTHPDRVRSLVLDGVDPPGASADERDLAAAAVDRLVAACAADGPCAAAHPNLAASLDAALAEFDRTPRTVPMEAVDGSAPSTLAVTGDDVYAGLFAAMYDSELVPLLPSLVEALRADPGRLLDTVASMVLPGLTSTATGAFLSVDCADAGAGTAAASGGGAVDDPGRAATIALAASLPFCGSWPVDPVPRGFADPVERDATPPALVVAGELDPVTPAAGAKAVADRLGATYVEVPRAGHSPMLVQPCTAAVLRSFLDAPQQPDVGCVAQMRPRPFA